MDERVKKSILSQASTYRKNFKTIVIKEFIYIYKDSIPHLLEKSLKSYIAHIFLEDWRALVDKRLTPKWEAKEKFNKIIEQIIKNHTSCQG